MKRERGFAHGMRKVDGIGRRVAPVRVFMRNGIALAPLAVIGEKVRESKRNLSRRLDAAGRRTVDQALHAEASRVRPLFNTREEDAVPDDLERLANPPAARISTNTADGSVPARRT